jgi:hypothetical protein
MVHIVEHQDFMAEDFMVEEAAASSTPRATNLPAPGATAVHSARQHTPVQTSRTSRAALGRYTRPESCCATLLVPRPRWEP